MLVAEKAYLDQYKTPSREVKGQIIYLGDEGQGVIAPYTNLQSFKIEGISPNGKFFGFAITKRIVIEVLGVLEIPKGTKLIPTIYSIGTDIRQIELPNFYVDSTEYNKVNKTTTIIGYDILKNDKLFREINSDKTYPMLASELLAIIAETLGGTSTFNGIDITITQAPNLDGTETIQSVLASLAEVCGAIGYVNQGNNINFRTVNTTVEDTLTPKDYFDFSVGEKEILTQLASTTALGNNITNGAEGHSFIFWDNPFLNLLSDNEVSRILIEVGDRLLGYSSRDYNLVWRGCPAYEIGDYIAVEELDGNIRHIYYLNETITYNGGLKAEAYWELTESENIEGTPNNISKTFGQAYAKVDKINREIALIVEETENALEEISSIKVNAEGVLTEVQSITTRTNDMIDATNDSIDTLSKKVQQSITSENMSVIIQQELANGVDAVTTKTGFTFDEVGLTIEKTGSEMSTTITEDGMTVYRDNNPVLIADNIGVEAINLYATTYLIIGASSRLEDYTGENGDSRTGCFWVGR